MQARSLFSPLTAQPFKLCLEREVFLSVLVWNDLPRVDLRICRDGYPTKKGCILNASRWAVLMDHLDEFEKKMSEVQKGDNQIDFNIHLGGNLYAAVRSPYPILDIRLRFMHEGKLLHTTKGVTLRFQGLNNLRKNMQKVYDAIPREIPCFLKHQTADDETAALSCKECSPNTWQI